MPNAVLSFRERKQASYDDLANELSHGYGVIIPKPDTSSLPDHDPLCALLHRIQSSRSAQPDCIGSDDYVIVSGIDISNPRAPRVRLNPQFIPRGERFVVSDRLSLPVAEFMEAWKNRTFDFSATEQPLVGYNAQVYESVAWPWRPVDTNETAAALMEQLEHCLRRTGGRKSRLAANVASAYALRSLGFIHLAVVGEVNCGKTTFVHALLGMEHIIPDGLNAENTVVFKIRYGRNATPVYRAHYPDASKLSPTEIAAAEVTQFCIEHGQEIDYMEVQCSAPMLSRGLVLVVTPGMGGKLPEQGEISLACVKKADAVIFLTDGGSRPILRKDIDFLGKILHTTSHVCFVQTKLSKLKTKSEKEARKRGNCDKLAEVLEIEPEDIPYFPVDSLKCLRASQGQSADKDLSGFAALFSHLEKSLLPVAQAEVENALVALIHKANRP